MGWLNTGKQNELSVIKTDIGFRMSNVIIELH